MNGTARILHGGFAVGSDKTMREDAPFEIATEGSLDMGRRCFTSLAAHASCRSISFAAASPLSYSFWLKSALWPEPSTPAHAWCA